MPISLPFRLIAAAGALGLALHAHADSFASSASSAGSASSGSISDSLNGSSNSSGGDKRKVADGEYRIIQIAATPERSDRTRVTMQAGDPAQRIVLDLPQTTFDKQQLAVGDAMYAQNRVYGIEFGRGNTHQPFYLVLADEWYGELASRPVSLLKPARALALVGLTCAALGAAGAALAGGSSASSRFCDRGEPLSAAEQDRLLRFAAVLREELAGVGDGVALVSRSGLDLSRFDIRYSHAALAWRSESGAWSARQLYYACDEKRPRIFDQGLAGFALGTDDPALGYVSVVRLPDEAIAALRPALLDGPRVQHLLASQYSASAYAFSVRYQNCNQWVMEMLAAGWGDLPDGDDLRARAQSWLRDARYTPQPVQVGSRLLMLASHFVPLLHLDDHPDEDRSAMQLRVSLPSTVEAFVKQRYPASERVELCHDDERIVIHRGWTPIAAGCKPAEGDRVVPLRD